MATRVLTLGKDDIAKVYLNGVSKPIRNAQPFFQALTAKMLQQAFVTFRKQGARSGHSKWKEFSERTLHPSKINPKLGSAVFINTKKWNKRPGTDGSKTRRYNKSSQLLQASGGFRNSFTVIKTEKKRGIVGTKMKLAKAIMSHENRQVLFVTPADRKLYTNMFRTFVDKGIKF